MAQQKIIKFKQGAEELQVGFFDNNNEIEIYKNGEYFFLSPNQTNELITHLTQCMHHIKEPVDILSPKTELQQTERERNKTLMILIDKLIGENDMETIKLLESLVDKDTPSMKKSFEIMTKNINLNK
jgi:transcriptional/translational regulatory protein YebC/TACO1